MTTNPVLDQALELHRQAKYAEAEAECRAVNRPQQPADVHRALCAIRDAKPATTTVQVVRLATDPRCLVEINAVAVID